MSKATNKVYLIGNREHNVFKVGFAQDVEQRRKALLTACPLPLEVISEYPVGTRCEAQQVEKQLHLAFDARKIQGEWFSKVTIEEFLAVARSCVLLPNQHHCEAKERAQRIHAVVKAGGMCQCCFKLTERGHVHRGLFAALWVCTECRDWLVWIKTLKTKTI